MVMIVMAPMAFVGLGISTQGLVGGGNLTPTTANTILRSRVLQNKNACRYKMTISLSRRLEIYVNIFGQN